MVEILLNGNQYLVGGDIQEYRVEQYSPTFSTEATQLRAHNVPINHWVSKGFPGGVGLSRGDLEKASTLLRLSDSRAETRFESEITLPLLAQDSTEPTLGGSTINMIRASVEFKGDLWGLFDGKVTANDRYQFYARKYTGSSTSWTGGGTIVTGGVGAGPGVAKDIATVGVYLVALVVGDTNHLIYRSLDGATWSAPAATISANKLADATTDGENLDAGVLVADGDDIYAFVWDEDNGEIEAWASTNSGNNWTEEGSVGSGNGPKGRAHYFDLNGDPAPVIGTEEGVYAYDTSANAFSLIFQMTAHSDNCRAMAVWNGDLYVSTGWGSLYRLTWNGSSFQVALVGPDRDDGLVSEAQGHFLRFSPVTRWLFGTYGGHVSGKNARVWAFDGQGWHFMYREGTADRELDWLHVSSNDDDTPRLHFSIRTATAAGDTQFLEQPLASPVSGLTLKYATPGYIDLVEFDGGDPHEQKALLRARVHADDLSSSTSGEYINIDYGTDGDGHGDTDLGNILSGTLALDWGSGKGLSARTLNLRVNLLRDGGSTAQSPKLKEVDILYEVWQTPLRGYRIPLDLIAMANEQRTLETLISELKTAKDSVTLVEFAFGGVLTDTPLNVRVVNLGMAESITGEPTAGERYSMPTIQVEERIAP